MLTTCSQAIREMVVGFDAETLLGEVLILRRGDGFELRHVADRATDGAGLREVAWSELRELARFSASGAFRPLKSSPNLRSGWICGVAETGELAAALNELYPGALADWQAVRSGTAGATSYREFTGRQTGMYRLTQKLDDDLVRAVTKVVCARENCLKRRLWEAPGLAEDAEDAKSCIPCLEPCAPLLEFARTAMRGEQGGGLDGGLTLADGAVIKRALERALENPVDDVRAADFGSPDNPARIQWTLERLNALVEGESGGEGE